MKNLFLTLAFIASSLCMRAQSLSGVVTDSATHEALPGAVVDFPQLRLGATTALNGKYKISNLPNGTYEVEVQFLGYATITGQITIKGNVIRNFAMTVSSYSAKEVIITALGNTTNQQRSPVPVTMVPHDALVRESSSNIVDAIATQPGVTAITTGPGISKPEINGLGYNRVLTLMDGERQEEFQWGDEHGVLIDPYAVYNAEIIRGAASLQYGANAVAGVVNFKSEPFAENGTIQGSVLSEYQTNNGLIGNSLDVGGNHNSFVWDLCASEDAPHCYSDPHDGYVWGTAFNQYAGRLVFGLNKSWGYSRLTVSTLHRQIEIPDGNRDSTSGQFEFDVPQDGQIYPNRANFLSYNPDISSYQILDHDEVWWQNSINAGRGRIIADIGFTQSQRHEIDTGNVAEENMIVNDIPYSIKYQVAGVSSGLKLTTGFNGMYEAMHNGPEPPSPYRGDFEIPNYNLFDIGGYAILNKDFKNLSMSAGLRYDVRTITGEPMYLSGYNTPVQEVRTIYEPGDLTQFLPFDNTYTGFSGSIGATYQLPENNYAKINFAKSYRAPAINELTSNEVNPGGDLYESGNRNLKPESGFETDVAFGNNGKDVNFEADVFYNYIDHFIFSDRLTATDGGDTTALGKSIYQYKANTAIIAGVAAYFNIHPALAKWIELDNGFTYIYSYLPDQTDSTGHVPWTPAPRLTSKVGFKLKDRHTSILKGTYFELGLAKYWAQNDIYSAYYTELPSTAYTLYNTGIGTNFVNHRTLRVVCSLYINVTNLLNISYIDHTARTQYFWAYNGKNDPHNDGYAPAIVTNPSEGIYNMGRNVGFKLIFPIGGHKVSDAELHGVEK